jgi:glycosyltransferase involved in cell wall biosynthesis
MSELTVLLLNYKRPQNLPRIITSLKNQTIPTKLFLWDNSGTCDFDDPRIDLVVRSSENKGCSPRWLLTLYAETDYIMTHDDDYVITKPNVLEQIIACLKQQENERTIVGYEGIVVDQTKTYAQHIGYENRYQFNNNFFGVVIPHYPHIKASEHVHLVKGRLMAARTAALLKYIDFSTLIKEREDDIAVSAMLGRRKRIHFIPQFLKDCIEELEDDSDEGLGNKDKPEHYISRNIAFNQYFVEGAFVPSLAPLSRQNFKQSELSSDTLNPGFYPNNNPRFIIISPFYNTQYLEKCLRSVAMQTYKNYLCVAIDDASQENYSSEIRQILTLEKFKLVVNPTRQYALYSRILALDYVNYQCGGLSDDDIIVHLDGDDWFADENSLLTIAQAYLTDTLATYGGAMRLQNGQLFQPYMHALSNKAIERKWGKTVGPEYPADVIKRRDYRNYPWGACHCRTFKYKLYKQIFRSDFLDQEGNYFKYATDMAIFLPILEMAGDRIRYINETIYIYNRDTGNHNVASEFKDQHNNHNLIRRKTKYKLFSEIEMYFNQLQDVG